MPNNPKKEIGNKGPCWKCGDTIFCNAKEYNGETKAQWQDKDGKAHYNKEGNCKGALTPNVPQPNTEPTYEDFKPQFTSPEEAKIWIDVVNKVAEYTILAQKELMSYPDIKNPALKGLITKISFEVLNKIQERQANG